MDNFQTINIVGLEHNQISKEGTVIEIDSNNILVKYIKHYAYGNGYMYVILFNKKENKEVRYSVHRLIAITYLPIPELKEGEKYTMNVVNDDVRFVVNHKNGNKADNRLENLEWCTSKNNIAHSLEAGLNKASYQIQVIDMVNRTTQNYFSINKAAEALNVSKERFPILISKHGKYDNPYMGRYVILMKSKDVRFDNAKVDYKDTIDTSIIVYDYVKRDTVAYNTLKAVSLATGVNERTIKDRLNQIKYHTTFRKTIAAYEFFIKKNVTNYGLPNWLEIGKSAARDERDHYEYMQANGLVSYMRVMEVMDKDGLITSYNSMKEASKSTGIDYIKIKAGINNNKLFNGVIQIQDYKFRWKDEDKSWDNIKLIN